MITAPCPLRPSTSAWPSAWSATSTASRLTPGSVEGPFGTAHDFRTPAASSRRSKCSAVAACCWMTKRGTAGERYPAAARRRPVRSRPVSKSEYTTLELAGHEVRLSNPAKIYFPDPGWTKLDLAEFYVTIADAALIHLRERPTVMKRFVNGIMEEPIWQKRVPQKVPDWLQTATVAFPSGRTAEELVANDEAHLVWAVNLGVIDFNPHPVRRDDLEHPDELRVYPKTSGSKGVHVNVRIEPIHDYIEVRRAALALAREVERRAPDLAT